MQIAGASCCHNTGIAGRRWSLTLVSTYPGEIALDNFLGGALPPVARRSVIRRRGTMTSASHQVAHYHRCTVIPSGGYAVPPAASAADVHQTAQ
ncbi:hypothetical protein AVEN_53015-1 [Araneus ventricosus]|uniref:Uncharacterized protein n=1 Tax=Araneus ventricosus TaxID=182803 RepID=A0A4Y2GCW0_ARAVE|nr:hypothetical protein AVEN_53015-1 [Araneus ventricosus]